MPARVLKGPQADKWDILKALTAARPNFDFSDRDLSVLSALLSFHPKRLLSGGEAMIVFPSNRSLSERTHGMPESTLRRHIAKLVKAGLIVRRDSPNGKRFARRAPGGAITRAFGFDLSPLLHRHDEIMELAHQAAIQQAEMAALREENVLLLRDACRLSTELAVHDATQQGNGTFLTDAARQLRRKLDMPSLRILRHELRAAVARLKTLIDRAIPEEMSANDSENERHTESQKKKTDINAVNKLTKPADPKPRNLHALLESCPRVERFFAQKIRNWQDLIAAMESIRPSIGIAYPAWDNAKRRMGAEAAAASLARMIQRACDIENPTGYLVALTASHVEAGRQPSVRDFRSSAMVQS